MTTIIELITLLNNQINSLSKQRANAVENGDVPQIEEIDLKIKETQTIINKLSA
jgi:flagellin-specific chaperone FliS